MRGRTNSGFLRLSASLAAFSKRERIFSFALVTSPSVKPYLLSFSSSVTKDLKPPSMLSSLRVTDPYVASMASFTLPNPKPPSIYGASAFEVMSLKRSRITLPIIFSMKSMEKPAEVLLRASSRASVIQYKSMEGAVVSGSVIIPTRGSVNSPTEIFSFSLGFSALGISAQMLLIFASISSTSMSPTTTTACMSGRYQVW